NQLRRPADLFTELVHIGLTGFDFRNNQLKLFERILIGVCLLRHGSGFFRVILLYRVPSYKTVSISSPTSTALFWVSARPLTFVILNPLFNNCFGSASCNKRCILESSVVLSFNNCVLASCKWPIVLLS